MDPIVPSEATLEQKQEILNTLAVLHQKLLATPSFPQEFEYMDKAIRMIERMAKALDAEVGAAKKEIENAKKSEGSSTEVPANINGTSVSEPTSASGAV